MTEHGRMLLDTTTRTGAPLRVRATPNGRGADVFVNGESVGSIDRGSWGPGLRVYAYGHRYPSDHETLEAATEFVAREFGAPPARDTVLHR